MPPLRRRKSPIHHTVHTRDPRYSIPQYGRGHGDPIRLETPNKFERRMNQVEKQITSPRTSTAEKIRILRQIRLASEAARSRGDEEATATLIESHDQSVDRIKTELMNKLKNLPDNSLERARVVHELRSIHAQRIDNALESDNKPDVSDWEKKTNRSDVRGVDYYPVPFAQNMPTLNDNFQVNNQLVKAAYEDYVGSGIPNIPLRQAERHEEEPGVIAYYSPPKNEIVYSADYTHVMKNGRIESVKDYKSVESMAHELGHAMRGNLMEKSGLKTRHTYHYSKSAFEEGSNEIFAQRFALNNFQIPDRVRREIVANPFKGASYQEYMVPVADLALLVNNGDERKAVKWIERTRTEPDHIKFIADSVKQSKPFGHSFQMMDDEKIAETVFSVYRTREWLEEMKIKPTMKRPDPTYASTPRESSSWYLLVS